MSDDALDLAGRLKSVDGIGASTAATLAEEFDDADELREVVTDVPVGFSPPRLSRLDGFSPDRAHSLATRIDESGVLDERDASSGHARRVAEQLRMAEADDLEEE